MALVKYAGALPDFLFCCVVRYLLRGFLQRLYSLTVEEQQFRLMNFVNELKKQPIAENAEQIREMYEVPSDYYKLFLGKRLKLSCLYFSETSTTLHEAEDAMLDLYCQRADVKDGHHILDLGGGFGALALYIAERFPCCKVTTISNAKVHKEYVEEQCRVKGFGNLEALDLDVGTFETSEKYDRIFGIQVLEHMKNFEKLFKKIRAWLKPKGFLFVEVCCHKQLAYQQNEDPTSALAFQSDEIVFSDHLLLYFQNDLSINNHWRVNGIHQAKSLDTWVTNLNTNRNAIQRIFGVQRANEMIAGAKHYFLVWREIFKYNGGQEWAVSHYLFSARQDAHID